MSRASANSVPKKCTNLYIKGTFCDLKCTNFEKRHCSEQLFSSCLLFASVVYGTGTYADRKFQASGRISDIFRPNKLDRNSFQCMLICLSARRYKEIRCSMYTRCSMFVSNVTMYLQLRLNFKLKRLKRHAYSHGILDNSFSSFFVPQQHCFLCVSTRCVLFLHVVRVFLVCAIFSKQNKLCL